MQEVKWEFMNLSTSKLKSDRGLATFRIAGLKYPNLQIARLQFLAHAAGFKLNFQDIVIVNTVEDVFGWFPDLQLEVPVALRFVVGFFMWFFYFIFKIIIITYY